MKNEFSGGGGGGERKEANMSLESVNQTSAWRIKIFKTLKLRNIHENLSTINSVPWHHPSLPAKKRRKCDIKLGSHLVEPKPHHNITS